MREVDARTLRWAVWRFEWFGQAARRGNQGKGHDEEAGESAASHLYTPFGGQVSHMNDLDLIPTEDLLLALKRRFDHIHRGQNRARYDKQPSLGLEQGGLA